MKTFEESNRESLHSGCLKFSTKYISQKQLFDAAAKWVEVDPKVLAASFRVGGLDQIALDFRYDMGELPSKNNSSSLYDVFKPVFTKLLGGDYMVGWDYGSDTVVIK